MAKPDAAVLAAENKRLTQEIAELRQRLEVRTKELTDAVQQQTATADVLRVISRSPSDLQRVADTIVESAKRLCLSERGAIWRLRDEKFELVAHTVKDPTLSKYLAENPIPTGRASIGGRAVLERCPVHMHDISAHAELGSQDQARAENLRTLLAVPLLREGTPIGVLTLSKTHVQPFTNKQIELVTTFADQAVIAIENTRLFEEVQARTREVMEALAYQTATSEVLNVISRSPTELQPVLDSIAATAARLCESVDAQVYQLQDGKLAMVAQHGTLQRPGATFPGLPLTRGSVTGRAVLDHRTLHVDDLSALVDSEYPDAKASQIAVGHRTTLATPLLRRGESLGAILLRRIEVRPFSEGQIRLLETFADQAVIAIENARLFEEVQARTRELQESLEFQTATSEVLSVISRSKFDLQPVVDTIVETAFRLCRADRGALMRFEQGGFRLLPTSRGYLAGPVTKGLVDKLVPIDRGSIAGRVALEGRTVHVHDLQADPEFTLMRGAQGDDRRTCLGVPLISNSGSLGAIILQRTRVEPFSDKQIELVETFADQAVIAFENTRLFEEVQARNRDLTALGEVARTVSSTLDLKVVLKAIVDRAVELSSTDAGSIFYYREEIGMFELGETIGLDEEVVAKLRRLDIYAKESGLGEAIAQRLPLQIPDLTQRSSEPLRDAVVEAGFRASLIVPLLGTEGPLGTLILRRRRPGEFAPSVVRLMQSFADQSAIALENARLFEEIAHKSRELEIASQHKSQFVANMSHELRTPLAAILGYAELLQEGFYEPQGPKSLDALTRIRSNGKHLLGLINTVLDIAKIESGQFSLNLGEYALENVVETVRAATEALAETKKLGLKTDVSKQLPIGIGDEQRLTQVLLNLVGNAIKFTDKGEVRISAITANGHFAVRVTDTGPGIPLQEQKRIFEQFHQVDSSNTKAKGGTGLGLAIAREIVEMHGGRIWVESTPGAGATFQMELPIRAANRVGGA